MNATDLAANQAQRRAARHASSTSSRSTSDIMPRGADARRPADLDRFYKDTTFGAMPGGVGVDDHARAPGRARSSATPRFGMAAHLRRRRARDLMFGAGYATAEERLFLMDAIRRTAKGTLAGLPAPAPPRATPQQLTDQDFSDEELTAQFDALPTSASAPRARARQADVLAYIDGINARIDEVNGEPAADARRVRGARRDARALDASPTPPRMAVLLVTQFTVSNGGEERQRRDAAPAFRERFGPALARALRRLPHAPRTPRRLTRRQEGATAPTARAGPARRPNVVPDRGSIEPRNALVEGPGAEQRARSRGRAAAPGRARSIGLKARCPHQASNAVLVAGAASRAAGAPLAGDGPAGRLLLAADLRRVRAARRRHRRAAA